MTMGGEPPRRAPSGPGGRWRTGDVRRAREAWSGRWMFNQPVVNLSGIVGLPGPACGASRRVAQ
jgi:hypothetical protein